MENNILLDAVNNAALTVPGEDLGGMFSPQRWAYAGKMTLLGMVMVFSVLALLWVVLIIFEKVMVKESEKPAVKPVSVPTSVVEAPPVAASSDNDEIIAAVIAAAIAAYMADEGNTDAAYNGGFRVVSFRRVQGGKAWNSKY